MGIYAGVLNWTPGGTNYVKITDSLSYGYILIYITGNNIQSLYLVADDMSAYLIKGGHGDNVLFYKKSSTLYVKLAYSMKIWVVSSSCLLNLGVVSEPSGLVQIPTVG